MLADVVAGRGHVVLLVGEPGIGKTRLATELGHLAVTRGARVAWGRSWDAGGAPAFWPWVQVLRACRRHFDLTVDDPAVDSAVADLAPLLPEMAATKRADVPDLESEQARFRLFDSVTFLLKHLAAQAPLVLLLDDLHAADEPSLHLLRFLAREVWDARVFVVGTYRDGEVRRSPMLSRLMGDVARASQRIHLRGLSAPDVALFIEHAAGQAPALPLVSAVHRITEGNPFFIDEVVRLLLSDAGWHNAGTEGPLRIPDEVRETIRRRLEPLGNDARLVLSVAALSGREFDERVVERVVAAQRALPVYSLLNDAVAIGVIAELPGVLGRYTFSHELVIDTLYNDLAPADRARLHRATGEVLEKLYAENLDPHLAEIAHHFVQAGPGGDCAKAIDYAARAGQRALRLLAFEEAVNWYERAVALMDASAAGDEARCRQLIALGNAYRRAGDFSKFSATFQRAMALARVLGDAELLARAAVGLGRAVSETGIVNRSLVSWLEEALAQLPERDDPLRVAVLARLSVALYFDPQEESRRERVSQQAVAMARRLGDQPTLAIALMTRNFALWAPGYVEERLAVATELVRVGEAAGNLDALLDGRSWRIIDLLELGDVPAALADLESLARVADELRQPRDQWFVAVLRAMAALFAGHLDEGMRLAQQALQLGRRAETPNAEPFFLVQQFAAARERGHLHTLETAVHRCADQFPALPVWRCGLASLYSELGRPDEARQELARLAADDFSGLPRDGNWVAAMCLLAEVCADLGDAPRARVLYDLLLPYAHLNAVTALGAACYGSVSYYLGRLAATVHHLETSTRHFEAAIAMNTRMGALPFVAHAQYAYARLLLKTAPQQTAALLRAALATAEQLGLAQLERKIHQLEPALDSTATAVASATQPAFHNEGEFWSVAYGDGVLRLKDSKGLRYIAWLVRHPGREFHAMHLEGVGGTAAAPGRRAHLGDAEHLLDAPAQLASTVRDLQAELVEAQQHNDLGRIERLQDELAGLSQQLATAAGLGAPGAGAQAERARLNVTRAIGAALKRVRAVDAGLARYLANTIKTGNFCVYRPDNPTELRR